MRKLHSSSYLRFHILLVTMMFLLGTGPGYTALPLTENNESPFAEVYEQVSPSVVLIEVESEAPQSRRNTPNPFEWFFNNPNPQQEQSPQPRQGMGSGVIIDREGHIVTNNHVIEGADKINVKIDSNEEYTAEVVGRDPQTDLAVIKLDLDGDLLSADRVAELGDSDTLKPGDYAIAIGNPIGFERTITVGVISGLGRHDLSIFGASNLRYQDFIQTDAQINPGNSGGALVDINGNVIGINNMYTARYAAIGFAIPINLAKGVIDRLIATGEVRRGFVGIRGPRNEDDEKGIIEAMELLSPEGAIVQSIEPNSPAEDAGLEHGDFIINLNGEKIKNFHDFQLKIGAHQPGDSVQLEFYRDGEKKSVSLTLADLADFTSVASSGDSQLWLGINVVNLDSQMAEQYNLGNISRGVVIVNIDENSPAADANIHEGDVILEIEDTRIDNISDFIAVKQEYENATKPILIYRWHRNSNGTSEKGYVAIRNN